MKAFFCLTLFICSRSFPQQQAAHPKTYECVYTTVLNYSIDNGENLKEFDSRLVIEDKRSFFYTVPTKETFSEEEGDERHVVIKIDTIFRITKFRDGHILIFSDHVFTKKAKWYTDTLYPMQWYLADEQKTIDSLVCYKATAFFKGRNYIAWYNPAILIPEGPWKLGGLPGLIVEAYDEHNQLHFLLKSFKSFDSVENRSGIWIVPDSKAVASYGDYIKAGNDFINRFRQQLRAQSGSCLDCQATPKIEFHNLENVFQ